MSAIKVEVNFKNKYHCTEINCNLVKWVGTKHEWNIRVVSITTYNRLKCHLILAEAVKKQKNVTGQTLHDKKHNAQNCTNFDFGWKIKIINGEPTVMICCTEAKTFDLKQSTFLDFFSGFCFHYLNIRCRAL